MLCKINSRVAFQCLLCRKRYSKNLRISSGQTWQVGGRQFFTHSKNLATESSAVVKEESNNAQNELSLLNFKSDLDHRIPLKIKRAPFLKNLFNGKYDQDILAFPEVLNNKEIAALQAMSSTVANYVSGNVDSPKVDSDCTFPVSALEDLKKMGLFGSRVPQENGGLGMTAVEHIRLMEACSLDSSLAAILNTHQSIAAETLLNSSSDHLKNKYLSKVASGDMVAALALSETGLQCDSDFTAIQTVASRTKERSNFYLNGKKIWVTNGAVADIFLVLAKNMDPELAKQEETNFVAFIVEKKFPGVKIIKSENILGIRGANNCSIEFHDTPIPVENVVGDPRKGYEVIQRNLSMNRLHIGAFASGLSIALVDLAIDHGINKVKFQKQLMNFEGVKDQIGKMMSMAYAIESMTYLTAALFDSTENPDLELEYSAVKVFCTEGLLYCANEAFKIFGKDAYVTGHPAERLIRDALMGLSSEGTNEIIRQFITLSGIDHVGETIKYDVQKLRNPLFFPKFAMQKVYQDWKHAKNSLQAELDLEGYLHLSLQEQARNLEFAVQKFSHAVEVVLRENGREVIHKEVSLWQLADMVIEIYAMTAVLSRASRAYCIGLPCANVELQLAQAYCKDSYERVVKLHNAIFEAKHETAHVDYQEIASESFKRKGYCVTPPFTRNY